MFRQTFSLLYAVQIAGIGVPLDIDSERITYREGISIRKSMRMKGCRGMKYGKGLVDLIKDYLQFMNKSQGKQQLIIAIDDLDLCSANAYKMAEQIRKYLIIPNVCIVISVKIDQLELCVREKKTGSIKTVYL